jgi:hypothetical protein
VVDAVRAFVFKGSRHLHGNDLPGREVQCLTVLRRRQ